MIFWGEMNRWCSWLVFVDAFVDMMFYFLTMSKISHMYSIKLVILNIQKTRQGIEKFDKPGYHPTANPTFKSSAS